MRNIFLIVILAFCQFDNYAQQPVKIQVDITKSTGSLNPFWAWFGYDEPNYTYMKDGEKLLGELADLSPVPVYVRCHNLMTSGDGTPALKWGSTNIYTEDQAGNPIYDWTITDRIFDAYVKRKMKPLAQIGFMPEALSVKPKPYKHSWAPGKSYKEIETGWAYPPKDYNKWGELVFQWVKHCVERYGKAEVESWYWEVWNEPNAAYWKGTREEFYKLYDYASEGVKRALPTARIGGPHATGGAVSYVRAFLDHCLRGTNYVTGKTGSPLDFIAFHAKGSPRVNNGMVRMGMSNQLHSINDYFEMIRSDSVLKKLPVIIGESDPEGCAACGMYTNPENAYRNGTLYSSYTAASIARIYDLAAHYEINLIGAVNWSFEFENQPWFYGFRDLSTNGVGKPVLNVFRMLGRMNRKRVFVSGDLAYDFKAICDSGVRRPATDVNALASADNHSVTVLLWNYHDDDLFDSGSVVNLSIKGIASKKVRLTRYLIDRNHSNSYEAWKKMESPQNPTSEQIAILEEAGQLQLADKPKDITIRNKGADIQFHLERQAVSLVIINY